MALRGDFHLPECDRKRCNDHMKELAEQLIKRDAKLRLVMQYPCSSSKYETSFKQAYDNCSVTILHKCGDFWEKIQKYEHELLSENNKIKCVTFRGEIKPWKQMERYAFFSKLNVRKVTSGQALQNFAAEVVEEFHRHHPQRDEDHQDKDNELGDDGTIFCKLPDCYDSDKPTHVYLLNSLLKSLDKSPLKSRSNLVEWANFCSAIEEEESHDKLMGLFLHSKVVPTMCRDKNLVHLVYLAISNHAETATSCALMLQQAILKPYETSQVRNRINQLVVVEGLLWIRLLTRRPYPDVGDRHAAALYLQLAVTYIMVLCDLVLSCIEGKCLYLGDTHLDTIEGRSLPSLLSEDEDTRWIYNWFSLFIKDMAKITCKEYRKLSIAWEDDVEDVEDDEDVEFFISQKLASCSLALQTILVYKSLRDVYRTLRPSIHLQFLKAFVDHKLPKPNDHQQLDASCALILQTLTLSAIFELRHVTTENVQDFCTLLMEIRKTIESKADYGNEIEKMQSLSEMLFFNGNPHIRQLVFDLIETKAKAKMRAQRDTAGKTEKKDMTKMMKKKAISEEIHKSIVLKETRRMLFPMLEVDKTAIRQMHSWVVYSGKFTGLDVKLTLHVPHMNHHKEKLRTPFSDGDIFYNEMIALEQLQHRNIVRMLAFQKHFVPQFYILESYKSLQTVLKNLTANLDLANRTTLQSYLVQAASAVEFCHSQGIVHRNLTADSLLFVAEDYVKLAGFHLCLKMTDGKAAGNDLTNDLVPTLWSAPESLASNEYSEASDVWMYGHLMYEILTHGCRPYYDLETEESDLTRRIKAEDVCLTEHKLITKAQYKLIMMCATVRASERASLQYVQRELLQRENTTPKSSEKNRVDIDDLEEGHKPSTEHGKGIPANTDPIFFEDIPNSPEILAVEDVSDTITKLTYRETCHFREKLVNMPPAIRIKLSQGALSDSLPHMVIKESSKEMPNAEFVIQRLNEEEIGIEASLERVCEDRMLGDDLALYVKCLHHVAIVMEQLHVKSWYLGDLCAKHIFVQYCERPKKLKVYLTSVANVDYEDEEVDSNETVMDTTVIPPANSKVVARAAPEVIQSGLFSPRSDVFCFGNLMWQTVLQFDNGHSTMHVSTLEKEGYTGSWETTHSKPESCPGELYDLMLKCTKHRSTARVSAAELVEALERLSHRL